MAKTYQQILKQIETLEAEADRMRRKEAGDVIARIREAIAHYGLTAADLGFGAKPAAPAQKAPPAKKPRRKFVVPVKYRDDAGHTWSGRGLKPIWLRDAIAGGKALKDFEVK